MNSVANISKGQQVSIVGRLQTRTWDDEQGQKRYITEVVAEEAYFADSKKESNESNSFGDFANTMASGTSDFEVTSLR